MCADAALQIDRIYTKKQHIEVVILQRLLSLIAVKRLRLTAQMPAGHQQLNAFRFQQRISHVHTVGHRNYVSVLAHQTSNLKSGGPGIEDYPMTWLNQLNGSFRNAAFHCGVQRAFIFH